MLAFIAYCFIALLSPPLPGDRGRALRWANRQRAKCGLDPLARLPRAERVDPTRCVFARALSGPNSGAAVSPFHAYAPSLSVHVPRYVRSVIWTFDFGLRRNLVGDERAEDCLIPTVIAADAMTEGDERALAVETRIVELGDQLGALEASFAATSRDLRDRIRQLERRRDEARRESEHAA